MTMKNRIMPALSFKGSSTLRCTHWSMSCAQIQPWSQMKYWHYSPFWTHYVCYNVGTLSRTYWVLVKSHGNHNHNINFYDRYPAGHLPAEISLASIIWHWLLYWEQLKGKHYRETELCILYLMSVKLILFFFFLHDTLNAVLLVWLS